MTDNRGSVRVRRTLAEWEALKAEIAANQPPDPDEGQIRVKVDGKYIFAPSVEHLQRNGFRVVISYRRYYKGHTIPTFMPGRKAARYYEMKPKGGITHVYLLRLDGIWAEGTAVCVAKDVFSKRVGYALAVNKALEMYEVTVNHIQQNAPKIEAS